MNPWKAMTLAGLLLAASNSLAQRKSCQVYGGFGITPLFYQTMAQAKMGYCLTEKLKIEASFVIVRDKLNGLFEQKFYSLGLNPNPRNFPSVPFRVPVTSTILRSETEEWILASKI
jgi:hypothetical protein